MSANVLGDKDINATMADQQQTAGGKDVKSMEYHRQMFQSKVNDNSSDDQYVSPSDNIMSPCSAKINALRNKHVGKVKPKSLFAQASARKLRSDGALGETPANP
ncbi:hypothetical protein ACO1O0_008847 [Amphichorda felina]